jgi:hypothetical protein
MMSKVIREKFEEVTMKAFWPYDAQYKENIADHWETFQEGWEAAIKECIKKIENEASAYAEPVWAVELINDLKEQFGVE